MPVALTDDEYAALSQPPAQPPHVPGQPIAPPPVVSRAGGFSQLFNVMMNILGLVTLLAIIAVALNFLGVFSITPSVAAEPTPKALATAVVPTYAPPQQQPVVYVPAAVATPAPVVIVETTAHPSAEAPVPTADLANVSALDDLANAVDLASGGNPLAATPVPVGAELPTVVVGPVDPSGGDAALMARACANSGATAACSAHAVSAEEQTACALDLAYGGTGCTPVPGISVHLGSDSVSVRVGR